MDIDKFVPIVSSMILSSGFGSLMDIDKFVLKRMVINDVVVSVL